MCLAVLEGWHEVSFLNGATTGYARKLSESGFCRQATGAALTHLEPCVQAGYLAPPCILQSSVVR